MGFMNRTEMSAETSATKTLLNLQVEQHRHDELYHREIARLSLHQRLNHMALHFAKYAGKISTTTDRQELQRVFVDSLVIALSTANILNVHLGELLQLESKENLGLMEFGLATAGEHPEFADPAKALRPFVAAAGRIAGACEKIDHLEEVNFRSELRGGIAQLSAISVATLAAQGIDPAAAVRERLQGVKKRLKLHGRI